MVQDDFAAQQRKLLQTRLQPQVQPNPIQQPTAPQASTPSPDFAQQPQAPAPARVTSPNGWYTQGTQTYDQNNLLQGDDGYNRAQLAQELYNIQTSADRGNTFNLDQWLAQHQDIAKGVTSGKGGEMINLPGGGSYDIRRNYNAGNNTGDVVSFGAGGDPGDRSGATAYGAGSGGGDYGGGGSSSFSASGGSGNTEYQQQIRALLAQQMAGYGKPVDENDPAVKGEMDSQSRLIDRGRQDRRAAAAERMAAQGLNTGGQGSGAFDAETSAGYEDAGAKKSDVKAQLMGRELQSRRDKLTQSMQLAMQSGDAEAQRSLQMQLAQMDDQMRRLGLQQSQSQFNDQYALQAGQFDYQRDKDAFLYGAG